jgi:hypothetical protein
LNQDQLIFENSQDEMLNWAKVVEEDTWNLDGSAQRLEETMLNFF